MVTNKIKANNCYLGPISDILFRKWFLLSKVPSPRTTTPKELVSPTNQECQVAQQQQVSHEPVTREQFLKERRLARSTTTSPLPARQSHQLKTCIEPPTPKDKLSPKLLPHH